MKFDFEPRRGTPNNLDSFDFVEYTKADYRKKVRDIRYSEPPAVTALANACLSMDTEKIIDSDLESTEIDPERLQSAESRLSLIYDMARKHHIQPQKIPSKHQELAEELAQLAGGDESLATLEAQSLEAENAFMDLAKKLSNQRHQSAKILSNSINQQLQSLAMNNANLKVSVISSEEKSCVMGVDEIEILISTNPGQTHKSLSKIVSGGELSRISLAIQVATAQTSEVATLVFDEVDVGIGGATADVVGRLLSSLGNKSQVLCVTHLAQVASKAQHHWQVCKSQNSDHTVTHIQALEGDNKVEEIARMISGSELSQQSIDHARMMLVKL